MNYKEIMLITGLKKFKEALQTGDKLTANSFFLILVRSVFYL